MVDRLARPTAAENLRDWLLQTNLYQSVMCVLERQLVTLDCGRISRFCPNLDTFFSCYMISEA